MTVKYLLLVGCRGDVAVAGLDSCLCALDIPEEHFPSAHKLAVHRKSLNCPPPSFFVQNKKNDIEHKFYAKYLFIMHNIIFSESAFHSKLFVSPNSMFEYLNLYAC